DSSRRGGCGPPPARGRGTGETGGPRLSRLAGGDAQPRSTRHFPPSLTRSPSPHVERSNASTKHSCRRLHSRVSWDNGQKTGRRSPYGRVSANGVALPLMRKIRARVDG